MQLLERVPPLSSAKGGDHLLRRLQLEDSTLAPYFAYLEDRILPESETEAWELVLSRSQYEIVDGILYHVEKDKTLRVVPPVAERRELFEEVHSGQFGGHLKDAKIS